MIVLTPATTRPTEPGWYVVIERANDRPLALFWSHASRDWRAGARRIDVTHYAGPVPVPREARDRFL